MPLSPGSQLGPYEIVAPLGAGGMGEVYRARDPRIGCEVAIKVLPPGVASDPDRLHRFEQEVRAAGALNQSNILTVAHRRRRGPDPAPGFIPFYFIHLTPGSKSCVYTYARFLSDLY